MHLDGSATLGGARLLGLGKAQGFPRRLVEVHEQGVDLLDHGQRVGVGLSHQGAFGDQSAADATPDGGRDICIAALQRGLVDSGLGSSPFGVGQLHGGLRVVHRLFTDGALGEQGAQPVALRHGLGPMRLGTGQLSPGGRQRHVIGGRVDAKQRLPSPYIAAFLEQPLLDDASGLRPHLGHTRSLQPAGVHLLK